MRDGARHVSRLEAGLPPGDPLLERSARRLLGLLPPGGGPGGQRLDLGVVAVERDRLGDGRRRRLDVVAAEVAADGRGDLEEALAPRGGRERLVEPGLQGAELGMVGGHLGESRHGGPRPRQVVAAECRFHRREPPCDVHVCLLRVGPGAPDRRIGAGGRRSGITGDLRRE